MTGDLVWAIDVYIDDRYDGPMYRVESRQEDDDRIVYTLAVKRFAPFAYVRWETVVRTAAIERPWFRVSDGKRYDHVTDIARLAARTAHSSTEDL